MDDFPNCICYHISLMKIITLKWPNIMTWINFLLFINVDLGYSSFSILIQLLQEILKNPHNLKTKHHFLAALKLRNNDCVPIHLLICLKGTSCFWSNKTVITTFSPNSEMVSCNPNPLNFFFMVNIYRTKCWYHDCNYVTLGNHLINFVGASFCGLWFFRLFVGL